MKRCKARVIFNLMKYHIHNKKYQRFFFFILLIYYLYDGIMSLSSEYLNMRVHVGYIKENITNRELYNPRVT